MRWRLVVSSMLVASLSMAGCSSSPDLRVDLRTDYVVGVELETALISLDDGPFEPVHLDGHDDFLEGVRLMKYDQLERGTHRVVVRLMLGSILVAERAAVVSLQDTAAVTVVMTRSCWGVSCDTGQACVAGACVDEGCNPETPASCPMQCGSDGDCGAGSAACSTGRCLDGICFVGDMGACGGGLFCHPDAGCLNVGSTGCPAYMQSVDDFCIDVFQSGSMTWVDAMAYCEGRGGSLCDEAQWVAACNGAGSEIDALVDDWEWTSDLVSDTEALKHGAGDCVTTAPHTIDDGDYGVRCCLPR